LHVEALLLLLQSCEGTAVAAQRVEVLTSSVVYTVLRSGMTMADSWLRRPIVSLAAAAAASPSAGVPDSTACAAACSSWLCSTCNKLVSCKPSSGTALPCHSVSAFSSAVLQDWCSAAPNIDTEGRQQQGCTIVLWHRDTALGMHRTCAHRLWPALTT
jgi:hypothetical protein